MLTEEQLDSFHQIGFLVVDNVLDDEDLILLENEYDVFLDDLSTELCQEGRIPSNYKEHPFVERFVLVVSHCPESIDYFNISLPLVNGEIDEKHYRAHTGPAVFGLLRNRKILDVVESVIGPEISSSPVQQMRIKPPLVKLAAESVTHSSIGLTTWHQDTVAVLPEADDTNQLTVWVAVTDANEENGCLVSIPKSHLQGSQIHYPGAIPREPSIPASIINGRQGIPLPVKRGGIVIFHKQNIHCSLPNRSDKLRWSLDLRYHPVGQPSGRPAFPGFVARSKSNPGSELQDPLQWNQLWIDAKSRIIGGEYKGPIFKDWEGAGQLDR